MTQGSQEIVFAPRYRYTLLQRRMPWILGLSLAIRFLLVVLDPADWWRWPAFLILAWLGLLALRRPRRIRFGSWIVAERTPFPPWVFSRTDADLLLSRLAPMRNDARLREILEDWRSGEVPSPGPNEQDAPDPRNKVLSEVAFTWGFIVAIALLMAWGWRLGDLRGSLKLYGGLLTGACMATLYCALRLWDERYRGDAGGAATGTSLARLGRWSTWMALLAAIALIVWGIRRV